MEPFHLSAQASRFGSGHPDLESVLDLVDEDSSEEIYGLCRLWITEGVPFVFRESPMLYEAMRGWLARRLRIHPKEITMIGSARVGYSLTPSNLGRAFGRHSDLDLVAVSKDLFDRLANEARAFKEDLSSGEVEPKTAGQERWWPSAAEDINRQLATRGFIDSWKIPALPRYPDAKKIANSCWYLGEKLRATNEAYWVSKISLRVYEDVRAFIRQNWINLKSLQGIARPDPI